MCLKEQWQIFWAHVVYVLSFESVFVSKLDWHVNRCCVVTFCSGEDNETDYKCAKSSVLYSKNASNAPRWCIDEKSEHSPVRDYIAVQKFASLCTLKPTRIFRTLPSHASAFSSPSSWTTFVLYSCYKAIFLNTYISVVWSLMIM